MLLAVITDISINYDFKPNFTSDFRFNSIRATSDTTLMVMSDIKPLLSNEYHSLADGSGIICADDFALKDLKQASSL